MQWEKIPQAQTSRQAMEPTSKVASSLLETRPSLGTCIAGRRCTCASAWRSSRDFTRTRAACWHARRHSNQNNKFNASMPKYVYAKNASYAYLRQTTVSLDDAHENDHQTTMTTATTTSSNGNLLGKEIMSAHSSQRQRGSSLCGYEYVFEKGMCASVHISVCNV